MAAANQYDRQNDAELGSGIYDKTKSKEPALCGCGEPIENPWYGARACFSCQRELRIEYNRIYPIFEDAVSTLMSAVITVYDDPLEFADDWSADPEWVKSLDDPNQQRREEWKSFLERMNAPEMVARRGTELTPYGWREAENEPLRDDEFQFWHDDPGSP